MQVEAVLLVLSLLFFTSIFTDKIGYKYGVPALLLFLIVGMLFGPDGIGKFIDPDGVGYILNIDSAQAISTIALCIILFSGGMDTKLSEVRPVMAPGVVLATVGVLLTTILTGTVIYYVFYWTDGFYSISLAMAILCAATMSSTDSASVFSILRTNKIGLKHHLRPLLELESGANDPMAYVLTVTMIGVVMAPNGDISFLDIARTVIVQLVMGTVLGFAFGKGMVAIMNKAHLSNESLYPIMVLTACIFIFSVTYYLAGNAYLAVYVGGLMIGNSKFTRKLQTKEFFDGLTWLSQLVMFLMLGLLVRPSELLEWNVLVTGAVISIVMMFISRPMSVMLCLWPFRQYLPKDKMLVSWVGLKGAVPIIFAILCMAQGVPQANELFNVIFLCVLISLLTQGTTISWLARRLKLERPIEATPKLTHFEIDLPEEVATSASEMKVTKAMLENGITLSSLSIPEGSLVIMVCHHMSERNYDNYYVPSGRSVLHEGDYLLLISDIDRERDEEGRWSEIAQEEDHWDSQVINNTRGLLLRFWHTLTNSKSKNI